MRCIRMSPPNPLPRSILMTEAQPDLYRKEDLIVGPAARACELLARGDLAIALLVALRAQPEEPIEQQHGKAGANAHREAVPAQRAVDREQDHEPGDDQDGGKPVAEERDHRL